MRVTVSRKAHFNAAHRLFVPNWTDQENYAVFGKCSNSNYHGHNYELIAQVTGEVDPQTGFVVDMKWLADLIVAEVEEKLDHKNLNLDVPEFADFIPTAEHIAYVIYHWLRPNLDPKLELTVTLYETHRNFVTYSGQ